MTPPSKPPASERELPFPDMLVPSYMTTLARAKAWADALTEEQLLALGLRRIESPLRLADPHRWQICGRCGSEFRTYCSLCERRPLPPEVLADALQDRIHPTSGKLIKASPVFPESRAGEGPCASGHVFDPTQADCAVCGADAPPLAPPPPQALEESEEPRCRYCNRMGALYTTSTARCCEISRETDAALDRARAIGALRPVPPRPQAPEESGEVCRQCHGGRGWPNSANVWVECGACRGTGRTQAAKDSGVAVARAQSDDSGTRGPPLPDQPHETGRSQGEDGERGIEDAAIELHVCALSWEKGARLLGNVTAKEIADILHDRWKLQGRIEVTREQLATEKAARGEAEEKLRELEADSAAVGTMLADMLAKEEPCADGNICLVNELALRFSALEASLDAARALSAKWRLYGPKPISNGHTITECCAAELDAILNPSSPATERGKQGDGEG